MRLLLDTHTFLWFIGGSTKLSNDARTLIEDVANEKLLSVVSLWEVAIKHSLGKLQLSAPFDVLIPQQIAKNGFVVLGITVEHTVAVATLPFHHRDPFDRMLIAQAMVERMSVVSADSAFDAYMISRKW